ncbi:MAG: ATP-binding protein [Candidatus Omnitrophota bacterium]
MDRGSFPRWIERVLNSGVSRNKVRLIFGARQTGKSTLLRRLSRPQALFINLQDRRQRLRFERRPDELVKILRARTKKRTRVLIDEIQKVPALLDDIQLLYDENPRRYEFILTGSSARKLRSCAANLLPGRLHQYHLFPLISAERKRPRPSHILPLKPDKGFSPGFAEAKIKDILIYGNLPGISQEKRESKAATLESYAEVYLEEEIRREALVRNIGPFSRFLELAALESGQLINLTRLSQRAAVPVATLRSFYQVLTETFIGYLLLPFTQGARKRLLTTPIFYFFDLGVRNALARLPLNPQILKLQAGTLFQQWAVIELWHRCAYLGRGFGLYFWRAVSGAEVDIVLKTPREIIPIEVKWTEHPRQADARHLICFLREYPHQAKRGFIICRCPEPLEITQQITAIPWQEV